VKVKLHVFYKIAWNGGRWPHLPSGRSKRGKQAHGIHFIESCVGPRADQELVIKGQIRISDDNQIPLFLPVKNDFIFELGR
jgi:hypothetical protein